MKTTIQLTFEKDMFGKILDVKIGTSGQIPTPEFIGLLEIVKNLLITKPMNPNPAPTTLKPNV